jgi:hypothetical protein
MGAMTLPTARGTRSRGTFLLADISGYTGFLNGVAEAHRALIIEADEPPEAYAVLSRLVGGRPYALLSDAAMEALEIPAEGMLAGVETYDDLPPLGVHVLALS